MTNSRNPLRLIVVVALCIAVTLAAGCSALRLGYGQADKFLYYWLDSYVDFDDAQAPRVREAVASWFQWNRRTQLNDYADLLGRIEADTRADTTPERVCGWWKEVRSRIDRSVEQAVPSIAELAATLKPEQVEHIAQKQAKSAKEFRDEFMQSDMTLRRSEALKRSISRHETLYGALDLFQKERLERLVAESPFDPQLAYDELRRRQKEALQSIRQLAGRQMDSANAQSIVRGYLKRIDPPPQESYRQHNERMIQHNCRLFASVHNMASPEQRQFAAKKLRGWADDLRALAVEPAG